MRDQDGPKLGISLLKQALRSWRGTLRVALLLAVALACVVVVLGVSGPYLVLTYRGRA